ncbi:unnamed protein product [Cochlearia groenlandica]
MVDAIAGFVVGTIGNYLIEEAHMLRGVKDDLELLKTELTCIQGYLKDAEDQEREDQSLKGWKKLVIDIAYDIEDVLDTCKLKAHKRSQRRGIKRLANIIGKKKDAYIIVDNIKILRNRIDDVTRKRETYGIRNLSEPRAGESASRLKVRQLRRAQSIDTEEFVIGFEDDAKILLEKILDVRENKRHMISIFGMGGLGKTALARKLYNSEDVKERFEYRAWTYVSHEYNTRDILMRIIRSLKVASQEEMEKIKNFAEEELEAYIRALLEGKKYFIVIDDIWEREAWESLKRALPGNHEGSRVIITTRIQAVAEGIDLKVYAHKLRFLTFEESWKLFEQKAFRDIVKVDQELERIGREMVKKCNGLPLAVVVLAGLMSRKRPNQWNDVCVSFWRRLKDDSIHISTVFDLSFKDMQYELKLCFLYLSIFPEDYEIDIEELIHLLVAEGFIQEDEEMLMEDVARYHIEELIDRSLVQAGNIKRGKVKSCRIHDLLRDMAINKAKELNFVHVYNENHPSTTCRRETIHHLMSDHFRHRPIDNRMRSIFTFRHEDGTIKGFVKTISLKLKLLRVLYLEGNMFEFLGTTLFWNGMGELNNLRYLKVANMLDMSTSLISNLHCLQTLHLSFAYVKKRTDLRKLTSLRYLMGGFNGELLIGDAIKLQTLRYISSYSWAKLKREVFINLRDLEIHDYSAGMPTRTVDLASFNKQTKLRVLKLKVNAIKLPVRDMDVIFPCLESLTIWETFFEEDPMPAFQRLPMLEHLKMKYCDCSEMSIGAEGFDRLRTLELLNVKLYELRIEEEAMPSLMDLRLILKREPKVMIPDRLRAIDKGDYT